MGISGGSSSGKSESAGYGYSSSLANSVNAAQNTSSQNVWGAQAPALGNLYQQAQDKAGQGVDAGSAGAMATGIGALSKLAGGTTPLDQFATPNSALAQQQLGAAATQIGNQFNRVVLPGLTSSAGVAGALGGSRDMLARGLAASDAQQQIADAGTSIYSNMWNSAASAAAGKTDAMLSAGQALPGAALQNFGLSWAPLQQLAGILGGPTVLGQSSGNSFGLSQAGSQSENWNSSKSTQSASNFGFNFF
jgi:hypothetical protein